MTYRIEFEPVGLRGVFSDGLTLLECARDLGVDLISLCGGTGTCGHCKVQVVSGEVSERGHHEKEALSAQEIKEGYCLACQTYPLGDCALRIPPQSLSAPQRTQLEGHEVATDPEPVVKIWEGRLSPPTLTDPKGDSERLTEAIKEAWGREDIALDIEVLRDLPVALRSSEWRVRVAVRENEIVALPPSGGPLGLAVDLGTTKIAAYLVDLETGTTLASRGDMNPQIAYGEDIISRISRIQHKPAEAELMQRLMVEALNDLVSRLCSEAHRSPQSLLEAVLVGNTAMHHFLLRLPVAQLAVSPFVPAVREALDLKARELGLAMNPGAYVHLLPNIAGFVGADHVAMLLASRAFEADRTVLALDIGTNTEVCLAHQGRMTSVSCASGPAFEGAHVKQGMRAANGAIEGLKILGDRIVYKTIGGLPPIGICGSGMLDALAQLRQEGILDGSGRMADHPRTRSHEGQREFVLVEEDREAAHPAVVITQKDVRALQLAKGAIRTGIQALLEAEALSEEEIDQVIVAGAFGTYIDISSAVAVGMLPPLPLERFRQIGNAAGMGAKMALISGTERAGARAFARRIGYLELSTLPHFMDLFTSALALE